MAVEFCDTKILVYAYSSDGGVKQARARHRVGRLLRSGEGALSVQVLQELYVTLTRKIPEPLAPETARSLIADLATWKVVAPDASDVIAAIDASVRWQISLWDAMMLTAAQKARASIAWSEDLNHGQTYDGVTARNPFKARG